MNSVVFSEKYENQPVRYIILDENPWFWNTHVCDSDYVYIAIGDDVFKIVSRYVEEDNSDFICEKISNGPDISNRRIISTDEEPLLFIRREQEHGCFPVLRFQLGKRPILITADGNELTVGLSRWDMNGKWLEYENSQLLNDGGEPIDA